MGFIYEFDDTYTREDMIDELYGYILNECEVFNFGEGNMKMESFENASYVFEINTMNSTYIKYDKEVFDTSYQVKFNRYYINHVRQKQRNLHLYNKTKRTYPSPLWERDGENGKSYLKRYYRGSRSKHLKRQSHKIVRRNKEYFPKGNKVNRLYDFWWQMY